MVPHSSTILLTLSGQNLDQPILLETLMSMVEIPPTVDIKAIVGTDQCQDLFARNVYLSAPMMVIYVQKLMEGSRQPIYPPNLMNLSGNGRGSTSRILLDTDASRQLRLIAIITHTGESRAGHY